MSDALAVWRQSSRRSEQDVPTTNVNHASGCYLHTADGGNILDAISSWWCKPLGHGDHDLRMALQQQAEQLEHTILADITHQPVIALSASLVELAPWMSKVFYASDGANAVEIALKMSVLYRQLQGQTQRKHCLALKNSYHGETLAALSVTELDTYRQGYDNWMIPCEFVQDIPYVDGEEDPLWANAQMPWARVEKQLAAYAQTATALVIEPIVQGAGGMKIISADFIKRLVTWAQSQGIHVIADEIMTGLCRTGRWLASEYAGIQADFICLGKNLTGGWLPLSAVMTTEKLYQVLYCHGVDSRAFVHSHTFSGNPLACAVANACLQKMQRLDLNAQVCQLQPKLRNALQAVADNTGLLSDVRGIGGIVAAECNDTVDKVKMNEQALAHGILLRPIGRSLYWLPPLTITDEDIAEMAKRTEALLTACLR